MSALQQVEIPLQDLFIHGLKTPLHHADAPRVLCLHGWLDNAASFQPLISLLSDINCVAIDLPGHGKSGHFTYQIPYTIASFSHYVLRVAHALNWEEFHIIGHSLGGSIAPLCATAAPHRVKSLILIDALGPIAEPASALPERLKRFHQEMMARATSEPRIYNNIEKAIESRLLATKMSKHAARLIVERQLMETKEGYCWRFDPKLRAASPSYFTETQVQSILQALSCSVLSIVAQDGYLVKRYPYQERAKCIRSLTTVRFAGNHHLHMDTPEPLAVDIRGFLAHQNRS